MRGGGFLPEIRREKSGHGRVSPSKRKSTSTCIMSLHTLSTIVTVTTHITNVRPRTVPIETRRGQNFCPSGRCLCQRLLSKSCAFHGSNAGGRINFLRRKSSDLFGDLFSERNSFIEDGSNYSFYEEISLDLK